MKANSILLTPINNTDVMRKVESFITANEKLTGGKNRQQGDP